MIFERLILILIFLYLGYLHYLLLYFSYPSCPKFRSKGVIPLKKIKSLSRTGIVIHEDDMPMHEDSPEEEYFQVEFCHCRECTKMRNIKFIDVSDEDLERCKEAIKDDVCEC